MSIPIVLFTALAGALSAVQAGANAQLVRSLGRPWTVALAVSLVTTACFLAALLAVREGAPEGGRIADAPWWSWAGGLCGALFVAATLFCAERLGSGVFTGLTVTAGILASLVMDHFGWLGFAQHAASPGRILGGLLMVAGVAMVAFF